MRVLRVAGFAVFCLCTSTALRAQNMDTMKMAMQMGDILASEDFCGLSYDQTAISDFISKHVHGDDMEFNGELETMTTGTRYQLKDMSPSAKTAHCAQTVRVAKSYGFVH